MVMANMMRHQHSKAAHCYRQNKSLNSIVITLRRNSLIREHNCVSGNLDAYYTVFLSQPP